MNSEQRVKALWRGDVVTRPAGVELGENPIDPVDPVISVLFFHEEFKILLGLEGFVGLIC